MSGLWRFKIGCTVLTFQFGTCLCSMRRKTTRPINIWNASALNRLVEGKQTKPRPTAHATPNTSAITNSFNILATITASSSNRSPAPYIDASPWTQAILRITKKMHPHEDAESCCRSNVNKSVTCLKFLTEQPHGRPVVSIKVPGVRRILLLITANKNLQSLKQKLPRCFQNRPK